MADQETITIYHENLFPDIPNSYLSQYNRVREDSRHSNSYLYNSGGVIMPPTLPILQAAWNDYILTPRSSFTVPRPEGFSDLLTVLSSHSFRFLYIPSRGDRRMYPVRMSTVNLIYNHDVRYCIILAALNTISYLKNMIMYNTRLFPKVDMLIPYQNMYDPIPEVSFQLDEFDMTNPNQYLARKIYVKLNLYRELDELVRVGLRNDFWRKIIEISNQLSENLIQSNYSEALNSFNHNRNSRHCTEYFHRLTADNMELKNEIVRLIGEEPLSEEAISQLYDLIVQANLENCS